MAKEIFGSRKCYASPRKRHRIFIVPKKRCLEIRGQRIRVSPCSKWKLAYLIFFYRRDTSRRPVYPNIENSIRIKTFGVAATVGPDIGPKKLERSQYQACIGYALLLSGIRNQTLPIEKKTGWLRIERGKPVWTLASLLVWRYSRPADENYIEIAISSSIMLAYPFGFLGISGEIQGFLEINTGQPVTPM